jgi:hypothetical protein
MLKQGLFRTLTGYLFAVTFAALIAGCGGSPDGGATGSLPTAGVFLTARTGGIVAVRVGETAILDGSRSTSPSTTVPLSYSWSFASKPDASDDIASQLQNATTATPSFTADARGTYMVQLVVSAEGVSSQRDIQLVVATIAPERITGPTIHQGLSSNCVQCHNGELDIDPLDPGRGKISGKSLDHLGTSNMCETCHTPLGYAIIPFVDHLEVFGNCSECHNGVLAIGKSEFHPPTDAECSDCHITAHFLDISSVDGSFDHSGIIRACRGCHNGTVSTGKTPTPPHPDTNKECGSCHTTLSFLGAYPDHTDPAVLAPGCDSCHGVGQVTGQPAGHPVTNVDCDICHSIVTFSLGGVFNHRVDTAVQRCDSCHIDTNTINALPMPLPLSTVHQNTTEDCGICHDTESFANAVVDHSGPLVVGVGITCDSCHVADGSGPASGMLPTTALYEHMPTTLDCGVCHTPGTFATGVFDHDLSVYVPQPACSDCHNNVRSVGKLFNHIPTNQDCAVCHSTAGIVHADFSQATFDHVGIDSTNCALCHDTGIATGKMVNHPSTVPTNLDCSACHLNFSLGNFDSFALTTFNHVGIDPLNCASCHGTGIATGKTVNHIPAASECSICHDSTVLFTSTIFLSTVHQGVTSGCEGCHNGRFSTTTVTVRGKPANHLPTDQDCYLCHTKTDFALPITPFLHVGITGNCASCHDGSPAFVALGARAKTDTPIHQNTTGDCSVCHNTNNFLDAFVDHTGPEVVGVGITCESCHNGTDATGKIDKIDHVVTIEDCGICHVPGGTFAPAVFNHTNIVDNCASCHDGVAATGMSVGHVPIDNPTLKDCSVCHNPTAFAGAKFNHSDIVDNCASCHNGNAAPGKANNHMPTNGDCIDCHQTTGFLPSTFAHAGIVDNCESCHDGVFARGKALSHVDTNQDCGVCHTPSGFVGAVFDHTGIVDNCAACHNGTIAIGMDAKTNPAHIITTLDCHLCHTTATFVGGSWSHDDTSTGNCISCHSANGGATPQPSQGHLNTTEQCDVCHSTNGWAPTSFSHNSPGNYPGDHRIDPGCSGCHNNPIGGNNIKYSSTQYAPTCAGCHANDFESEGDHIGGSNGTVAQNMDCSGGGSGCHKVGDSGF